MISRPIGPPIQIPNLARIERLRIGAAYEVPLPRAINQTGALAVTNGDALLRPIVTRAPHGYRA
jgi:hypothetical protein